MAGTNDFLPWAQGANPNIMGQSDFVALKARPGGFQSGVADSSVANKLLRQASWMAYLLSQFIVNQTDRNMLDDGNFATAYDALQTALYNIIQSNLRSANFATVGALSSESQARQQADQSEAQSRATAISSEATSRTNADAAIYSWVENNFCERHNDAQFTRANFIPNDGEDHTIQLGAGGYGQGGTLFIAASVNIAAPQPSNALLRIFINGGLYFEENTSGQMSAMVAIRVGQGNFNIDCHYITPNGVGGGWKSTSLNLGFHIVSG